MIAAPPMAQVVQTALAHMAFAPPSLSASSREPSAKLARTATVIAVPNAMAKVAATPAQNRPWARAKTSTRIAPVQGLMPTENTTAATLRQENGPASLRAALIRHKDALVLSFTESLMTYALGRRVETYDMPAVRTIVRNAEASGFKMSSFINGIIKSAAFQRGRVPVGEARAAEAVSSSR